TIAEDMSYNHGPMVSKELFDTFLLPYYRRLVPEIQKHGTRVFVDSDGDITSAVPWFIAGGIEGILPLERQSGVDVAKIRARYPDFLMLGGFDKMCMFQTETEIRAEIERVLPTLRKGKYLPAMDHQTPPGTPIENYRTYVKLIKEYGMQACKDSPNAPTEQNDIDQTEREHTDA
ncbi:MAG: uroporphyrinogen decarboxylase family protein, partial [Ruthenibacterium sp.]